MSPLTHLVDDPAEGLIAVPADDPRASSLNVVDVAPPGHEYTMAARSPAEIDREPKARRWVVKRSARVVAPRLPDDAIWFHQGTSQQTLGSRHVSPPGTGWSLRATAADGEQFEERRQTNGKCVLITTPVRRC